jgi:ribosomal-protein-alanine N-acetyltransferase
MWTRNARADDWLAIHALIQRARFSSAGLWPWETYLADEGFLVTEVKGNVEGALLASTDASPVAWIRLAVVSQSLPVASWLDLSLPTILQHLRDLGAEQLTWMDHGGWAGRPLTKRGFLLETEVITLIKIDRQLPEVDRPPVALRLASNADFAALSAIDRAAFRPTWWRSETSMRRRVAGSSCFTVAQFGDEIVGYTESELRPPVAHLNRIAVEPTYQGRGIGAFLLAHTLTSLWNRGAETVSLNTQRWNHRSRRLYDRFGFEMTGDSVAVWARRL